MTDHYNDNFDNSPKDQDNNTIDLRFAVKLFFVSIFYMIMVSLVTYVIVTFLHDLVTPVLKSLVNLLSYSVSLLLIIRYATNARPQQRLGSVTRGTGWKMIWLTPVLIISTLALCVWVEGLSLLVPMPEAVEKFFNDLVKPDVFSILTIVVAAPILEEVLCRGILLKGLLKNYSPDNAIGISAIFFGAIHLNPWQAIPALAIGIFLGWVFYKTRSVLPGIIIHATVNGTSVLMTFYLPDADHIFAGFSIPVYILWFAISAVIFAAGCLLIQKKGPSNLSQHPH